VTVDVCVYAIDRKINPVENSEIMRSMKLILAMICAAGFLCSCAALYSCGAGGSIPQYQIRPGGAAIRPVETNMALALDSDERKNNGGHRR